MALPLVWGQGGKSNPNTAPSSPEDAEAAAAAGAAAAGVVAAAAQKMQEDGDEEEAEFDYDDIELDDEEAAQRHSYETQQVDDDEDAAEGPAAEKDDDYEDDENESSDSEDEEVRHRVKKSRESGDLSDEEANKKKDTKRAPATTQERMLQLRQENQRLRKSVPIDFGKRQEEDGAKVNLFNLIGDLKAKQPEQPVEEEEKDDNEETVEEAALLDQVVALCDSVLPDATVEDDDGEDSEVEAGKNGFEDDEADDDDEDAETQPLEQEEEEEEGKGAGEMESEPSASHAFDPKWLGGELSLSVDDTVRIFGLKGAPQHNDKHARVESYTANMDGAARYTVVLADDARLHVKPVNLEKIASEGAAAAPTVTDEQKATMERNRQAALAKRQAR